jgi:hypothetical protein
MNSYRWYLSDLKDIEQNGLKVFSTFSCGGGSSMGYKLAGYNLLGNCEIDPQMMKIYRKNHNPKYSFLMDIRKFNKLDDLPEELFSMDPRHAAYKLILKASQFSPLFLARKYHQQSGRTWTGIVDRICCLRSVTPSIPL